MGLGAYLAASTDSKSFQVQRARERKRLLAFPHEQEEDMYEIFSKYKISRSSIAPIAAELRANGEHLLEVGCAPNPFIFGVC